MPKKLVPACYASAENARHHLRMIGATCYEATEDPCRRGSGAILWERWLYIKTDNVIAEIFLYATPDRCLLMLPVQENADSFGELDRAIGAE